MAANDSMPEGDAGDQLAAPPQVGDMAQKGLTVPREYLPNCKVGDTYTVESADDDNVVLEDSGNGDDHEAYNSDMMDAMKKGGQDV
jgi:hypothetical protein